MIVYEFIGIFDTVRYVGISGESEILIYDAFAARRYCALDGFAGIFGSPEDNVFNLPVIVKDYCER